MKLKSNFLKHKKEFKSMVDKFLQLVRLTTEVSVLLDCALL